jgi:hypothetical protein
LCSLIFLCRAILQSCFVDCSSVWIGGVIHYSNAAVKKAAPLPYPKRRLARIHCVRTVVRILVLCTTNCWLENIPRVVPYSIRGVIFILVVSGEVDCDAVVLGISLKYISKGEIASKI